MGHQMLKGRLSDHSGVKWIGSGLCKSWSTSKLPEQVASPLSVLAPSIPPSSTHPMTSWMGRKALLEAWCSDGSERQVPTSFVHIPYLVVHGRTVEMGSPPKCRTPGNTPLWDPLCPEETGCEMRPSSDLCVIAKVTGQEFGSNKIKKLITRRLEKEVEWVLNLEIFVSRVWSPQRSPFAGEIFKNQSLSPTSSLSLTKWNSGRMEVIYWLNGMNWAQNQFGYLKLPRALNMAPYWRGRSVCHLVEIDCIGPPSSWGGSDFSSLG